MKQINFIILLVILKTVVFAQKLPANDNIFYKKLITFSSRDKFSDPVHKNDEVTIKQKSFIENDFGIDILEPDSIFYVNHEGISDSCLLQYSLLSFYFFDTSKVIKIQENLSKEKRINYKTPVLTIFKIYYGLHEILFISSETPTNPLIKRLLIKDLRSRYANFGKLEIKPEN